MDVSLRWYLCCHDSIGSSRLWHLSFKHDLIAISSISDNTVLTGPYISSCYLWQLDNVCSLFMMMKCFKLEKIFLIWRFLWSICLSLSVLCTRKKKGSLQKDLFCLICSLSQILQEELRSRKGPRGYTAASLNTPVPLCMNTLDFRPLFRTTFIRMLRPFGSQLKIAKRFRDRNNVGLTQLPLENFNIKEFVKRGILLPLSRGELHFFHHPMINAIKNHHWMSCMDI